MYVHTVHVGSVAVFNVTCNRWPAHMYVYVYRYVYVYVCSCSVFLLTGFELIQWWASIGIVACYWSVGEYSAAEEYYTTIESGG